MLSFALSGTIECVLATAPDEITLAVSSVLTRPNEVTRVAWVLCTVRDRHLRQCVLNELRQGHLVRITGEIEQRRRQVGDLAFHSVGFIARSIERLSVPSA